MQFKFEILKPSEKAIKIIEAYEELGFAVCLQFSEDTQWKDDTDYITFNTIHKGGDGRSYSVYFKLPKTEFEEKITYYDWMSREKFEKLCKQNRDYKYVDVVLTKSIDGFHYRGSIQQFKVLNSARSFVLGYYCDGAWWRLPGDRLDVEPFKYVKIIKYENE